MFKISIIIPTFNDEEKIRDNIFTLIKKLKKLRTVYELIIVNDGSNDNTLTELKKVKKKLKKIKLLSNKKNYGKSYSIKKGLDKSKYNHVILIDSDLPYFDVFEKVLKNLRKNDFVFVNRKHQKSLIVDQQLNFYQQARKMIGYLVSLIIRLLLNLNIQGGDTQSGLKGFKKIKNFKKLNLISKKFFLDLEIMYFYKKLNKKFYSIPVKYKIDKKSSIELFAIRKNFLILIELINVIFNLKNNYFFKHSM